MRTASSSVRIGPPSTRTATGCSARSTTPTTRCRRRSCGHGAASAVSRAEARSAPGSTGSPPTAACGCSRRRPRRAALARPCPAGRGVYAAEPTAVGVGLARAVSGRAVPARGRHRGAGSPLRAARECRACLRRGAPASAAAAACRAAPARGARLLCARGRRASRHHRPVREQRPAASPPVDERARARAEPAGDAPRARRRALPRARHPLHGRDRPRGRRRAGRAPDRRAGVGDAAGDDLVPGA